MTNKFISTGIHIGTVSVSIVIIDENNSVVYKDYSFHNGKILDSLEDILSKAPVKECLHLGFVSAAGSSFIKAGTEINEQAAIIEAVRFFSPETRSIVKAGGEKYGVILLDEKGNYKKYISNGLCAAGTGSFIDQQALRLNLKNGAELSACAEKYANEPPKIAARCAVFAKTDILNLQQQGYTLNAIAAGVCKGVAQNIYDTLFPGNDIKDPIAFVGGVSKNRKVTGYLSEICGRKINLLPEGEYITAIGAALIAKNSVPLEASLSPENLLNKSFPGRQYNHKPLSQISAKIPDFSSLNSEMINGVETDIYEPLAGKSEIDCYLGIDIGSTSTKAVLMDNKLSIIAGFYTYTCGQPVEALQKITSAIENIEKKYGVNFRINASGTTGSGRSRFIQGITGSDYSVDEITAHARAAYHLNPEIDTIIEIGGQDSKFTLLKNGKVTFSIMNYSCAAGTGSFIQEQANRLNVSLKDYAELALNEPAPSIDGRCTVFMERDLNHLLSLSYKREELLASVLHSVRDNYLLKVGQEGKMGKHIAFQGATAKNHALVKAFVQKLEKPIYVSKYCHLTGAMGTALKLSDKGFKGVSKFKKNLHSKKLELREYICGYCSNRCTIKYTNINGERHGWGYLCGRNEKDISRKRKDIDGLDLINNHEKVFSFVDTASDAPIARNNEEEIIKIGLPASVTMYEYMPLWKMFFKNLGIDTVVSKGDPASIAEGKALKAAHYCAPITELHGHIAELKLTDADYIFLPQLFAEISGKEKKLYCYHSNFAFPVIHNTEAFGSSDRIIAPSLDIHRDYPEKVAKNIYRAFPSMLKKRISFSETRNAYSAAWEWFLGRKAELQNIFKKKWSNADDIGIVFLGRPYITLNPHLNKDIPRSVAEKGIMSFSMDMIPVQEENLNASRDFLNRNHWHYGDLIMKAAETVARTEKLFPIYLTAFRCSPDSFVLNYFRDIMDYYEKPYLIIQLDEHENRGGYETRLEAAIETFRNHAAAAPKGKPPSIKLKKDFTDKTYLLPNYDPISARLQQGAFARSGIKLFLIEETADTLQRACAMNDGMCLPLTGLYEGIVHTIKKYSLDPAKTAVFINSKMQYSCNYPQYAFMIKRLLNKTGSDMEKVEMLESIFFPTNLPVRLLYENFLAYVIAGLLQRMVFKIRPTEKIAGSTDKAAKNALEYMYKCFAEGGSKVKALKKVVEAFKKIEVYETPLPKVGLVGDIFLRDNDIFNQDIVRKIEKAGAEVVSFPLADALKMIIKTYYRKQQKNDGMYFDMVSDEIIYRALMSLTRKYAKIAEDIVPEIKFSYKENIMEYFKKYGLTLKHDGEVIENLLKVIYFNENYPDIKFIVNLNPMFCCPSLSSEAIYKKVEKDINTPIVSISYGGTKEDQNEVLKPYLHFLNQNK